MWPMRNVPWLARSSVASKLPAVFVNWFRSETREAASDPDHFFVEKVTVRRPLHSVDAFVVIGWTLILVKCVLASLAIHRWAIPIHDLYIWGPSFIFGAVCTYLYLTREEK
jgi:hypothetical protein